MSKVEGILKQIEQALNTLGYPVYYGRTFARENSEWNYFVFNRQRIERSGKTGNDFSYYYQVHIIMENYISETFELEVIEAIQNNTKLKLSNESMTYNYVTKNNTDIVAEMLTLSFVLPVKRCGIKEGD